MPSTKLFHCGLGGQIIQKLGKLFLISIYHLGVKTKLEAVSEPEQVLGSTLRPDSVVVCAWGDDGAAARDQDGSVFVSPATSLLWLTSKKSCYQVAINIRLPIAKVNGEKLRLATHFLSDFKLFLSYEFLEIFL